MKPRNIESIFRLTPLQEGLLFHTLEASRPGAYFDQFSVTLETPLSRPLALEHLEQAWNDTVAQHAVLRTLFTWEKRDQPLQIVKASAAVPFDVEDLSSLAPAARQERLQAYLESDRSQGFVLDQAPLMRVRVFTLGPQASRMVWSFHHLILDGWSVRLLLAEVRQRYEALLAATPFQAVKAPSFEAFVSWQRERSVDAGRAYWQEYLRGFSSPTTPRVRAERSETSSEEALQSKLALSADLTSRLSVFAKEHRVTLNTLFVAAWGVVLSRYCDRRDVVFGTTSAGRPPQLAGVDGTAGLFITTLPLRIDFDQHESVGDMLGAIQKEQAVQRDHDHVGLGAIQKCSEVPAGIPLFETLVVFENFPAFSANDTSAFEWVDEQFAEYSHYPLALLIVPGENIELICVHQPREFSTSDVKRMLDSVVVALEGLMSQQQCSAIDCMGPEHLQTLHALARGPKHAFSASSVIELFEQQVLGAPEATALSVGDKHYSYAQLNSMANHLARHLEQRCAEASAVVIYCQRDHWAIVAQLASLKARKVYVTLDAKDPASRIDFVLNDIVRSGVGGDAGGVPVLVTHSQFDATTARLGSLHERVVCDLMGVEAGVETGIETGVAEDFAHAPVSGHDPAYVIYTSGSTGKPKGVLVSHGSLMNSTSAREPFYGQNPAVFALLSSLATDSSIAGLFWTLCSGGTLVLPAERAELDVEALAKLFVQQHVSHTLCVPSLYSLMLEAFETTQCPSLLAVIVAGEACPLSLVRRHGSTLPEVALYNEYGPSEACVWVTAAQLRDTDSFVSIGRPVSNVEVAVVDREQRLAPLGVAGELWVSGDNLAEGYINRPESNERSFVERSLFKDSNEAAQDRQRYYRTGDKVVMDGDGQLEYLGRIDHQLKVRGYRVEPGEVEAALCQHALVDAAVVLIEDGDLDAAVDSLVASLNVTHQEFLEQTLNDIEQLDEHEVERALVRLVGSEHTSLEPSEQ